MKKLYKTTEECPLCSHNDTQVVWREKCDNKWVEREFFLCHYCGFFCHADENKELSQGITVDPKIIPLKQQLNAFRKIIKKNPQFLQGLVIRDHFKYKPPKDIDKKDIYYISKK